MKYVGEYRDPEAVERLLESIRTRVTRPWTLMEVCGGQTHSIIRFGIDELLPSEITLVHGPGCPVCVTGVDLIDHAIAIARQPGVIFCSFGDMMRVPGSTADLLSVKAEGGDLRIVYSPLDALRLAEENSDKDVVFFAVGFETTAPATALSVAQAAQKGISNYSLLTAHVLVPPAMEAILSQPDNEVQAFLAAGHVCAVTGYEEYRPLAERHRVPIVVTGFEPVDILSGVLSAVSQLEAGQARVENRYARVVQPSGNQPALRLIEQVFEVVDRDWRGVGRIPASGWGLREGYRRYDAAIRYPLKHTPKGEHPDCHAGEVLRGVLKPDLCPAFGTLCTPEHPLGATMVSSEGACAAYYRYRSRAQSTMRANR